MVRDVSELVEAGGPLYYLRILHGNVVHDVDTEQEFVSGTRKALAATGRTEVDELLCRKEWRGRLFASWVVTCNGWNDYTDRLGDLLVASELAYAGEGYCTALASFRTETAKSHLIAYLDRYLPRLDLVYDQRWAFGALTHIDPERAMLYRQADGLWDRWSQANGGRDLPLKEIAGLIRLAEKAAGTS